MNTLVRVNVSFAAAVLFLFSATIVPLIASAQTTPDLSATIRAELLSDPRTSSLSAAQLDAMVSLLTQQAQAQGITAEDITWRPQTFSNADVAPVAAPESCAGNFTCVMDEAFGFIGPDILIPFALGAASMGLIWILAEMIHRKKYPHLFV
jgi:hypothetical protein